MLDGITKSTAYFYILYLTIRFPKFFIGFSQFFWVGSNSSKEINVLFSSIMKKNCFVLFLFFFLGRWFQLFICYLTFTLYFAWKCQAITEVYHLLYCLVFFLFGVLKMFLLWLIQFSIFLFYCRTISCLHLCFYSFFIKNMKWEQLSDIYFEQHMLEFVWRLSQNSSVYQVGVVVVIRVSRGYNSFNQLSQYQLSQKNVC